MQKVQMLQQCGVQPIIVFDGGRLPMKAAEEGSRSRLLAAATVCCSVVDVRPVVLMYINIQSSTASSSCSNRTEHKLTCPIAGLKQCGYAGQGRRTRTKQPLMSRLATNRRPMNATSEPWTSRQVQHVTLSWYICICSLFMLISCVPNMAARRPDMFWPAYFSWQQTSAYTLQRQGLYTASPRFMAILHCFLQSYNRQRTVLC